jgi:hypothetical protein
MKHLKLKMRGNWFPETRMPWKPGKILREKGKRSLTEMYIMDQL